MTATKRYRGLFVKKSLWVPSRKGWLVILLALYLGGYGAVRHIHDFLSVSNPLPTDVMVVEGWLPDYALVKVAEAFKNGNYRVMLVTGGHLSYGSYLSEYKSLAELSRATLIRLGVDKNKVITLPSAPVKKDRTYAAGRAVAEWIAHQEPNLHAINLYTHDTHARRSRLLYQDALGRNIQMGVVAIPSEEYDIAVWWKESHGIRTMISETIGYAYAKLFLLLN